MTILTKEVLQEELQTFAETVVKPQLAELADLIRNHLSNDVGQFLHRGNGGIDDGMQTALQIQLSPGRDGARQETKASVTSGRSFGTDKSSKRSLIKAHVVGSFDYLHQLGSLTKTSLVKTGDSPSGTTTPRSIAKASDMKTVSAETSSSTHDTHDHEVKRTKDTMMAGLAEGRIQQMTTGHHRNRRQEQFELFMNLIILLNVAYIGVSTEYLARTAHRTQVTTPPELYLVEWLFWIVFTIEMILKLAVYKLDLFRNPMSNGLENRELYWNIFDCVLLFFQFLDLLLEEKDPNGIAATLRVMRVFRLLRVVRAFKLVRFISGIRAIVHSLLNSLNLFLWSLVALLLVTYLWAVYFTETVRRYKLSNPGIDFSEMDNRFGSLWKSQLSLIQSVTGGVDWSDVLRTLWPLDWVFGVFPFLVYVLFGLLGMMNVITGIFLETASRKATEESDRIALASARETFAEADANQSGTISWEDFEKVLEHKKVGRFFKELDLDMSEGKTLFDLLDSTGDGRVSANDFLGGCLRVCGHAKALDLLVLSREVSQLCDRNNAAIMQNREMAESRRLLMQECRNEIHRNRETTDKNHQLLRELRAMLEGTAPAAPPAPPPVQLPPKLLIPSSQ